MKIARSSTISTAAVRIVEESDRLLRILRRRLLRVLRRRLLRVLRRRLRWVLRLPLLRRRWRQRLTAVRSLLLPLWTGAISGMGKKE